MIPCIRHVQSLFPERGSRFRFTVYSSRCPVCTFIYWLSIKSYCFHVLYTTDLTPIIKFRQNTACMVFDVMLISLLQIDIDNLNTDIHVHFKSFFFELIMSTTIHCRVLHGNASSRFFLPSMHSTIWSISLSKLWSQMPVLTTLCTQKNDAFYYCL